MNTPVKKLACIIPDLALGGAQRSLIIFANEMSKAGWNVDIIIFSNNLELSNEFIPEIKIQLIKGSTLRNPLVWYRTRRLLLKIKPKVVVAWGSINLLALATRMPWDKWHVIICERIYLPIYIKDKFSRSFTRKIVLTLIKYYYRHADIVTANSLVSLRFLRLFIGTGPTYLHMPNSVDTAVCQSLMQHIQAGFPDDSIASPHILALGRLEYQKGFDILLEAMTIILQKKPWKLVVVGEGSEGYNLKAKAKALEIADSIIWFGAQSNPFPFYKWADIVVVPSRYEGFPNVPLEAMACGCAVICTDCMTGPRELTQNGRVGILVPTDYPGAIASAIIKLGNDPDEYSALGKKALMHVKSNYDIRVLSPLYISIVEHIHG
jgi:glycosyltransferase involved in cell wall biosynthesis